MRLALMALALACACGGASVAVANEPPDASFGFFPTDPVGGQSIRLVSYACDPDGVVFDQAWDLDADGVFDDAFGPTATTSFTPGSHPVALRVDPLDGPPAFQTRIVNVVAGSPPSVPPPFEPPLLSPFPVVRIVGQLTRAGAMIRFLSVRAPVCSRVTTFCRGRGCPFRKDSRVVGPKGARVRPLAGRRLPAGVRLVVIVTKRDRIGKYTRFTIRRGKPPRRFDRCARFGQTEPSPCG